MTREPPCRQVVLLATCDDARVALTATIYTADIDMADHDRGVYETLALRVARHPSESDDYLVTRLLAYALEYTEGLEFSTGGLSSPDDPALAVRDLTGALRSWIEIGWPDPARLHKAAKASPAWRSTRTGTRGNGSSAWKGSGFTGRRTSTSGPSTSG